MFIGKPVTVSERQWKVLSLGIVGMKQKQIGQVLGITLSLVKKECVQICNLMKAVNFKHAVAKAVREGDVFLLEDLRNRNDLYAEMLAKSYIGKKKRRKELDS